jgi:hypothetical protein
MAEKDNLRTIAGKALAEPSFRGKLLKDPEGAVKEAGFDLTQEYLDAQKTRDRDQLEASPADLDERLTMGCWTKVHGIPGLDGPCYWH